MALEDDVLASVDLAAALCEAESLDEIFHALEGKRLRVIIGALWGIAALVGGENSGYWQVVVDDSLREMLYQTVSEHDRNIADAAILAGRFVCCALNGDGDTAAALLNAVASSGDIAENFVAFSVYHLRVNLAAPWGVSILPATEEELKLAVDG